MNWFKKLSQKKSVNVTHDDLSDNNSDKTLKKNDKELIDNNKTIINDNENINNDNDSSCGSEIICDHQNFQVISGCQLIEIHCECGSDKKRQKSHQSSDDDDDDDGDRDVDSDDRDRNNLEEIDGDRNSLDESDRDRKIDGCSIDLDLTIPIRDEDCDDQSIIEDQILPVDPSIPPIILGHQVVDPDEFFSDPDEVLSYRTDKEISENWVIIDSPIVLDNPEPLLPEDVVLESSSVKFQKQPSVISLKSYEEKDDEYGIFTKSSDAATTTTTMPTIPEAQYCCNLLDEINLGILNLHRWGIERIDGIPEGDEDALKEAQAKFVTKGSSNSRKQNRQNRKKLFKTKSQKEALARSLMGPLVKHKKDGSSSNNTAVVTFVRKSNVNVKSDDFSVQKYFGLNDYGDIILHYDHIDEEEGFGFLSKESRRVPKGVEVKEKKFLWKFNWKRQIRRLAKLFGLSVYDVEFG